MSAFWGQMVRSLAAVNVVALAVLLTVQGAQAAAPLRIVVLGDSLSAGYRLPQADAFPAQLERKLQELGYAVEVANAGISGDTTAAGLARLDWAVPDGTDAVIVELGANDALRGLDPAKARRNLETIVERLRARGIEVMLAGMLAPGNLGEKYATAFNAIFPKLAKTYDLVFYPFFLQGVALRQNLNLDDGLHPNAQGVAHIVDGIVPTVRELIERVRNRRVHDQRG